MQVESWCEVHPTVQPLSLYKPPRLSLPFLQRNPHPTHPSELNRQLTPLDEQPQSLQRYLLFRQAYVGQACRKRVND